MEEITPEERQHAIARLEFWINSSDPEGRAFFDLHDRLALATALAALRQPDVLVETGTRPWGIKLVAPEHEVIDRRLAALEQAVLLDAQASLGGLHARIEQLEARAARASSALGGLDERIAKLEKFGEDTQVKVQEVWNQRNDALTRVNGLLNHFEMLEGRLEAAARALVPFVFEDDDDDEIERYDRMEE